jgi:phenylalanyl-tRNA synthetase beta chain
MKFSHRFLKELSGTKKSAKELERLLMFHAFEVEEVTKYEHGLDDVYIALVETKTKHPDADKLSILSVNVGRQGVYQIICGAPNVAVGQKVAVVLPGASLPGNFVIEERQIRGVKSFGMVCSEKELGLGEAHTGILVLPEDAPVGALFAKHFWLDDSILDIKILPDRAGDALSYQGIAREIAALDGYAPEFTEIERKQFRIPAYNRAPKVTVTDKQGCQRYMGLYFENIENGDSPLWLKIRLLLSGLRPKNIVVDLTNYLMLLTGQPVHAFDADLLKRGITVRKAKKGEKIKILTGETIKLDPSDVVIADGLGPVALAGVMGGSRTAVTKKTKNIFLEIATFDATSVRKTRSRHRLFTDASYRYERGLDNMLPKEVSVEAVDLFQALTGGKLLGLRDERITMNRPHKIKLALTTVQGILGSKVPLFEVVQYLALLGLKVKSMPGKKSLEVTVPTRRRDLVDEWNLIEEIARMRGYEKITPEAPLLPLTTSRFDPFFVWQDRVKDTLAAKGFSETLTYSFISEAEGKFLSKEYKLYSLLNPLTPEESILRPTLVPSLTKIVLQNLRLRKKMQMFEIANTFMKGKNEPKEETVASLVVADGEIDFFTAKNLLEELCKELHLPARRYQAHKSELYAEGQSAEVLIGKTKIASLGVVSRPLVRLYDKNNSVPMVAIEIFLEKVFIFAQEEEQNRQYTLISRFPLAVRDISLAFPHTVTAAEVETVLAASGAPLLKHFELFDVFKKDKQKRFAYHLAFGLSERTLTSEEMEVAFQAIVMAARKELGGLL